MEKKIIGVLVCMLFIATAIPAVQSSNIQEKIIIGSDNSVQPCGRNSWNETQKLLASDGEAEDLFGSSLSIVNNTLLVGAYSEDDQGANSGAVYVFNRNNTNWTQQTKILPSDGKEGDEFGYSIIYNGDTALIGAPYADGKGAVYVFAKTGKLWSQQQKLIASDGSAGALFGSSIALSGNSALIGAPSANAKGAVYVFNRIGFSWGEEIKLVASDGATKDNFGQSVSLDDETALIGAYLDDDKGADSGSAYVFIRFNDTWVQQAKIVAGDGAAGDTFGYAVSLIGDIALIGAPYDDDGGADSGSTYLFTRSGTTWSQKQKLLASDDSGYFGTSIAQEGNYAIIGAPQTGSVYLFVRAGTTWTEETKMVAADGGALFNRFGQTVSLSGETAVIGSPWDDDKGSHSGSVYIFMSQSATYDLEFLIKGGLGVKVQIINNGSVDATDVDWQIHVEGGILKRINKNFSGIVDIPASETKIVKTGVFFGFGPITITATVIYEQKTTEGKQFIIFSIIK